MITSPTALPGAVPPQPLTDAQARPEVLQKAAAITRVAVPAAPDGSQPNRAHPDGRSNNQSQQGMPQGSERGRAGLGGGHAGGMLDRGGLTLLQAEEDDVGRVLNQLPDVLPVGSLNASEADDGESAASTGPQSPQDLARASTDAATDGATEEAGAAPTADGAEKTAQNPQGLTEEERRQVEELKERDREVRAHEQAHARVGGPHAGAPTYDYQTGPDNKRYAVGGQVSIDISPENTPEKTIAKMDIVKRAALAPAEPSPQDRRVAAQADAIKREAQAEKASESRAERQAQVEQTQQSAPQTPAEAEEPSADPAPISAGDGNGASAAAGEAPTTGAGSTQAVLAARAYEAAENRNAASAAQGAADSRPLAERVAEFTARDRAAGTYASAGVGVATLSSAALASPAERAAATYAGVQQAGLDYGRPIDRLVA